MNCPKCNQEVRQMVTATIDMPVSIKAITKALIRKREVQILSADWIKSCYYCPCGWWQSVPGMNNET